MQLVERFWAVATSIISIVSFSPLPDSSHAQLPISGHLPSEEASLLTVPPIPSFPIFAPPGAGESDFQCEYPAMPGWAPCSSPMDRKCWLRRAKDGQQFDINTNYEDKYPEGITRYYHIELHDSWFAGDGQNFTEAKLFREIEDAYEKGIYPGPWIQACWGDRLVVKVTNRMQHNGTSVHWHGIRQLNTVHMDGVNGVTQCPIAPGDSFTYDFKLRQYGSSWYHSHYSVQYADGAVGPLTIHGPSSADWDESINPPLIMTDWYHKSAFYLLTQNDTMIAKANKSILLHGRGDVTKFDNKTQNTTSINPPYSITLEPYREGRRTKKYLIRVINTSFDTTFVFSIDNHILQVISADFVPIQPYRNTSILVGIGQRYNVIVEANPVAGVNNTLDKHGNYWIRTEIAACFRGSNPGHEGYELNGVLRYDKSSKLDPTSKRWPGISLSCSDETYTSLNPILPWFVDPPANGEQNGDSPRFGQNFDVYLKGPREPLDYPIAKFTLDDTNKGTPMRVNYSDPVFFHLDPSENQNWPELWRVVPENYSNNSWIYLVLHGSRFGGGTTTGAHPIHLHGHDFAILEQARNKTWNPKETNFKRRNPPRRDVVLLPTDGYVVIAFKADNPGPWLVHCHIAVHISMGLGMQIMEDQAGAFKIWPDDDSAVVEAQRVCRNWDTWFANRNNWAHKPPPYGHCNWMNDDWCFQDDSGV